MPLDIHFLNLNEFSFRIFPALRSFFIFICEFYAMFQVESIHQYIESMRTAYLSDQRRRGDGNDPFLEADRREMARQEAAAKRVHPTLHLPAAPQPTTQVAGLFASTGAPGVSNAPQTSGAPLSSSSGMGNSLFAATPASTSSSSLFSTPATTAGNLFTSSIASPQSSLFPSSSPSMFTSASTPSLFGGSAPASAAAGTSLFSTPFGSGT